jgi:hypothetical protein
VLQTFQGKEPFSQRGQRGKATGHCPWGRASFDAAFNTPALAGDTAAHFLANNSLVLCSRSLCLANHLVLFSGKRLRKPPVANDHAAETDKILISPKYLVHNGACPP